MTTSPSNVISTATRQSGPPASEESAPLGFALAEHLNQAGHRAAWSGRRLPKLSVTNSGSDQRGTEVPLGSALAERFSALCSKKSYDGVIPFPPRRGRRR